MLQSNAFVRESGNGKNGFDSKALPISTRPQKRTRWKLAPMIVYGTVIFWLLPISAAVAAPQNQAGLEAALAGQSLPAEMQLADEVEDGAMTKPRLDRPLSKPLVVQKDSLMRVEHENRSYWGRPLAWDGNQLALIGLDGQLKVVPTNSPLDVEVSPLKFKSFPAKTIRERLAKEFGNRYEVTITKNFVVVHPNGDSDIWAPPFEALYERFRYYFKQHQYTLTEPEFPLVAVVLRSRNEFDRYLDQNAKYDRNVMGIYQVQSNRMITYDPKAKLRTAKRDKEWLFKYKTVIHELAHQAAFNSGVHNRFSPPARWVGEGLAMMFETDGVNHSQVFKHFGRRVNRPRLRVLKKYYQEGKIDGKLDELITDDRLFQTEPFVANTLAWGLTFYLSETFPAQYFQYLKQDNQRKNFETYLPTQRRADFANSFGRDIDRIDRDLRIFILGL